MYGGGFVGVGQMDVDSGTIMIIVIIGLTFCGMIYGIYQEYGTCIED